MKVIPHSLSLPSWARLSLRQPVPAAPFGDRLRSGMKQSGDNISGAYAFSEFGMLGRFNPLALATDSNPPRDPGTEPDKSALATPAVMGVTEFAANESPEPVFVSVRTAGGVSFPACPDGRMEDAFVRGGRPEERAATLVFSTSFLPDMISAHSVSCANDFGVPSSMVEEAVQPETLTVPETVPEPISHHQDPTPGTSDLAVFVRLDGGEARMNVSCRGVRLGREEEERVRQVADAVSREYRLKLAGISFSGIGPLTRRG